MTQLPIESDATANSSLEFTEKERSSEASHRVSISDQNSPDGIGDREETQSVQRKNESEEGTNALLGHDSSEDSGSEETSRESGREESDQEGEGGSQGDDQSISSSIPENVSNQETSSGIDTPRLQVGECVVLTPDFASHDDAANGFLKPGDVGVLEQDDHDSKPFKVRFKGKTFYYVEAALRRAPEGSKPDQASASTTTVEF